MGVSPTGNKNTTPLEKSSTSNKDKFAADQSHEIPEIFTNIIENVSEWQSLKCFDDIEVKRLNGNSNAVFRVKIKDGLHPQITENRLLLYRRYEQDIIDK